MGHNIRFRIDEILKQREQSLYWLAQTTGVSYTTLWRLTKDRALGMNFATLQKLCAALDCRPGDLMEIDLTKEGTSKRRNTTRRAERRTSSPL